LSSSASQFYRHQVVKKYQKQEFLSGIEQTMNYVRTT